jgi:hypothetical protein
MADVKKTSSHGSFVIVPNTKLLRRSSKQSGKTSALIEDAVIKNRGNRIYKFLTKGKTTEVVVQNKDTGRQVSKFSLPGASKNARLRKFKAKARKGTISPEKIFKAI